MRGIELAGLIATVFGAVTCVVIGDTAGKLMTSSGIDPVWVAWTRFGLAALVLLPFSGLTRAELPRLLDWRVVLRGFFIAAGISCILTALRTEPLANVFGAFFIGPVVAYVLAILFLGERPAPLRSLLLAVGFAGVMLVVKPGFGATIGMAFALTAGTFYGAYLVMTRVVSGQVRPRFLLLSQLLLGTAMLTPFGLGGDWPGMTWTLAGLVAISAGGSAMGNFLLVMASRRAEASLIAPLVYSQLLSAMVLGALVFGDWPDVWALAGLALIALSGVGSLLVGQRQARLAGQGAA
ncbi:DMT family transporter [Pseudooceanicola marinus]|uniref:DMT family transporter n=1 Tax=Pseudooceanicola marinus TaxID=396013 RepID=UPI001CD29A72|nr:DMT family transporter [Pseudooceanicola marinus]MCA1337129.1 DMT family transporter [Pseudooceanicola marinus]